MALPVYRLRRWLAVIAVVFSVVIAGMYLSARLRQHSLVKDVPGKIGFDIKQTAKGFQFSKSEGGRTLFTIEASNLKQFKLDGRAELHNVSIVLYGRDSSRFDRVYGDDFIYDPKSGDVRANGEVQIELQANPSGVTGPDQAAPRDVSNAIHLKTRDLLFNKDSGNASTANKVEFRTPQATGSAVGMEYAGKANTLTLASEVHIVVTGKSEALIEASHAVIMNDPRRIVLEAAKLVRGSDSVRGDEATLLLAADNTVQHVYARGNVVAEVREETKLAVKSAAKNSSVRDEKAPQSGSLFLAKANEGELSLEGQNLLRHAVMSGDVHFERIGEQPMEGYAGRATFEFAGRNELKTVRAAEGVRLLQAQSAKAKGTKPETKPEAVAPQNFELAAPAIDFLVAQGRFLRRAVTLGEGAITISPASATGQGNARSLQRTVVTAEKFDAKFEENSEGQSRLASIHGAPNAKIVSTAPDQPDRTSTSETVDASFLPQGGIESLIQQGHVAYADNLPAEKRTQAWAERAHYAPADQILTLNGEPRITQGATATTATTIRINRATGEASAQGGVKSTYSQLQENPQGALFASASPIHVTSQQMTGHNEPAVALYTGNARLWQDANVVEAPSIEFDRDCRCVTAQGTRKQPVETTIVQETKTPPSDTNATSDKSTRESAILAPRSSPIFLSGTQLRYQDLERKAHYEGGVSARGSDFTASAKVMDVYLKPRSGGAKNSAVKAQDPSQLDHIVARNDVVVEQPSRRALGQTMVYEADADKFRLTGGPPSIFDAEKGKITGVSLTFFRRDDRVLVEGESSNPVVTETRVAQ